MRRRIEGAEVHRLRDAKRPGLLQRFLFFGKLRSYGGAWLPKRHQRAVAAFRRDNPGMAAVAIYVSFPWSNRLFRCSDLAFIHVFVTVASGRGLRKRETWDGTFSNPFQRTRFVVVEPGRVKIDLEEFRVREIRLKPGQVYEVYFQSQAYFIWNFGGQKNIIYNGFSPAEC